MSDETFLTTVVMKAIAALQPDADDVARHIADLRIAHPTLSKDALAAKWANKICWRYASAGAVTALPGAIPGWGTLAQVAIEGGAISTDLAYMLRCMAGLTIGVGVIYEREIEASFHQDFVRVLGIWCGVLTLGKEATLRVVSKVAIAQFKKVPAVVFKKINQKVGTTIVTKYGTKRCRSTRSIWRRRNSRGWLQSSDNEGIQESCHQLLQDRRFGSIRIVEKLQREILLFTSHVFDQK